MSTSRFQTKNIRDLFPFYMLWLFIIVTSACSKSEPEIATVAPIISKTDRNYSIFLNGSRIGEEVVSESADGKLTVHHEYLERGRGPTLDSTFIVRTDGIPISINTSGHDYLKATVEETFTLTEEDASWSNLAESGSADSSIKTVYVSKDGPTVELEILAGALRNSDDKRLPLWPAGEASMEHAGDKVISNAAGQSRTVSLYFIMGLTLGQSPIWLNEDGTLFGKLSSRFKVISSGWENADVELLTYQTDVEDKHRKQAASEITQGPEGRLLINNVNIFDTLTKKVNHNMAVEVEGNRIVKVENSDSISTEGSTVIDGQGKMLLPGLWDMHGHFRHQDGPLNIAAGITSARSMAGRHPALTEISRQWDAMETVGPRVWRAGIIDGRGPRSAPSPMLVSTREEAEAMVRQYADWNYDQIKIYSSLDTKLVQPIVDLAHELGMRVSGHIPAFMWAEDAVKAGYDEIQHVNMLFLNFYKDVEDTRGPERFTAVAQRGADLDLNSDEFKSFVSLLLDKQIVLDPTVTIFEDMFTVRPGEETTAYTSVAHRLPPQVARKQFLSGGLEPPEGMGQKYKDSFQRMLDVIGYLHKAGVQIVAGTDALAGFTLHRELELYVKAGISPEEVLYLSSLGSAKVMGIDKDLGSIEVGKLADFILVDGDPTVNISDIRKVSLTIKDGVVFNVDKVYALVGVLPR